MVLVHEVKVVIDKDFVAAHSALAFAQPLYHIGSAVADGRAVSLIV
jgi:hypothetical protein